MTAKLPPAIQQKILQRRNSGARIIEIADELELSRHTVAGYCRIADQKTAIGRAPAATLTEAEVDRLRDLLRRLNLTATEFQGLTELARRVRKLTCPDCNATVWALPTGNRVWCEGCSMHFAMLPPRTATVSPSAGVHRSHQSNGTSGSQVGSFVRSRYRSTAPTYPNGKDSDPDY